MTNVSVSLEHRLSSVKSPVQSSSSVMGIIIFLFGCISCSALAFFGYLFIFSIPLLVSAAARCTRAVAWFPLVVVICLFLWRSCAGCTTASGHGWLTPNPQQLNRHSLVLARSTTSRVAASTVRVAGNTFARSVASLTSSGRRADCHSSRSRPRWVQRGLASGMMGYKDTRKGGMRGVASHRRPCMVTRALCMTTFYMRNV